MPSREEMDPLLASLPAYFEATQIHISGLIVASYAGEDYSHYLAQSSLGVWLKEQGVPAIYGVDTRALTKKIRKQGSMLGRLLLAKKQTESISGKIVAGVNSIIKGGTTSENWRNGFELVEWDNPNTRNLVAEGMYTGLGHYQDMTAN